LSSSFPDARTELAGVAGHPIAHSLSPVIHNAALSSDGRNAVYLAFDVAPDDFPRFVEGMRSGGARGLNITVPHKTAAFALATWRSEDAEATGAVNTLVFEKAGVRAENTDVEGARRALADLGVTSGVRALVLGAGGAGRAAARALKTLGADVLIANRTPGRADEAAGRLGVEAVTWEDVGLEVAGVDLIVQATSVGLQGGSPLDTGVLEAAAGGGCRALLDVVYASGETEIVRTARASGIQAADGLGMLVHQATEAYRMFWGTEAPVEVMRGAALRAAGRQEGNGQAATTT
jgi:shikimate dehydrogenase